MHASLHALPPCQSLFASYDFISFQTQRAYGRLTFSMETYRRRGRAWNAQKVLLKNADRPLQLESFK
jgi:hypothetical protein